MRSLFSTPLLLLLALGLFSCNPDAESEGPAEVARAQEPPGGNTSAPIRLLDRVEDAEVEWPSPWQASTPSNATSPESFRPLREARVGRVEMLSGGSNNPKHKPDDRMSWGDSRMAILAPSGTRYRFSLRPPAGALLRVGLGHAVVGDELPAPVRYRVEVGLPGTNETEVVLDEIITARFDGDWTDFEIDLTKWSLRDVTLTFTTADLNDASGTAASTVWAAWSAPELVSASEPEGGYDVILISLDTLRADHLSSYGYARPTSPNLDAFAAEGIRFATAVSQAPWTQPSHESIFSGFYPKNRARSKWPRISEVLHDAGYRTAAITGGGLMDFRMGRMDFSLGFDSYRLAHWVRDPEGLKEWLASTRGRRRFLFLHTYEIHGPHNHTEFTKPGTGGRAETYWSKPKGKRPHAKRFKPNEQTYFIDLYDSAIAYTDRQLAVLFDELRRTGDLDRSIVIITSDHGEQFWEHGGALHGGVLYDHQLLVPLILHLPPALMRRLASEQELTGRVIDQQVSLVDLYPTILDLLDIPLDHEIDGRSLRPLLEGATLPHADALAEYINQTDHEDKALRTERYKLIQSFPKGSRNKKGARPTAQLFDLNEDPREQIDIASREPNLVAKLERRLTALRGGHSDVESEDEVPAEFDLDKIDPDLEERLRALGYLGE